MQTEPKSRASLAVYCTLAAVWLLLIAWLGVERAQVARLARQGALNRARDISNTIALVSRSGPPGAIPQSRLEALLGELIETTELTSVALLNAAGETVATAGEPLHVDVNKLPAQGARWERGSLMVVNLVDFGQSARDDGTPNPPTVVISRSEEEEGRRRMRRLMEERHTTETLAAGERRGLPPPFAPEDDKVHLGPPAGEPPPAALEGPPEPRRRSREPGDWRPEGEEREGRASRAFFRRPFWMDQKHYEELLAKRGLHGFVLVMSTGAMQAELARDLWLRLGVALAALAAAAGLGLGWRGLARATQLRIRLVRAQEMNEHLREMNLAAVGLAHEARNPLNIVRGVAQMIARKEGLPGEVREQAGRITEEVDRVTQRLNEFIKYSRPMQPRPAATSLAAVVSDVLAALQTDLEDKRIQAGTRGLDCAALADESMLRQVVFNLALNAVQAVREGGRITVAFSAVSREEGMLSVEDDGPGVAPDLREQIFRPYFTTNAQGTGLGLAVVKQIVLAHHWEIECGESEMGGAAFRIRGIRLAHGAGGEGEARA